MRFLKQRWVIVALAVAATAVFIIYGWPKLKTAFTKSPTNGANGALPPANGNGATGPGTVQPGFASLQSRLVGPVTASSN